MKGIDLMAKSLNRTTFSNAFINLSDMTIVETTKDDTFVYNLRKILEQWDGVDGISLKIDKTADITPDVE
jgi:hypothetical protein